MEPTEVGSSRQRLLKRRNVDFLLGEDTVVVDIPDDDTPKQSEGMKEGASKLPYEPKEESVVLLLAGGEPVEGSVSIPPAAPDVYVPGWGITRESLLSQHNVAYDWGLHAFPQLLLMPWIFSRMLIFLTSSYMWLHRLVHICL